MVATEEEASPQQQNWQGEEESWYASGDADGLPEYAGRLLNGGALRGC